MKFFLLYVVSIPLLVNSYKDERFLESSASPNRDIQGSLSTSASLFGTDTKIYYIRSGHHEFKYTIGKSIVESAILHEEDYPTDKELEMENFVPQYDGIEGNNPNFEVVHPEILLIIDYDLYERFNKSEDLIISYLVSYWNSVDMRFSEVFFPMIRLHISGIIIAEDPEVLPYLQTNEDLWKNIVGSGSSFEALSHKGQWLYNMTQDIISLCDYDIAVTMTLHPLCLRLQKGVCIIPTHGITWPSKVCSDDFMAQITEKIAIIQNVGAYDRINFVARQIGSLLGSESVGEHHCSEDDGSLSSRHYTSVNSSYWSRCSEEHFGKLLKTPGGRCLTRLRIFKGVPLKSYLPGSVMDADEQCRNLGWAKACRVDESICRRLKCTNAKEYHHNDDECVEMGLEAPDGTSCGDDRKCILSECTLLTK